MSVIHTTSSRVKVGRLTEAINVGAAAGQLLRRNGAKDCRLMVADVAGEQTGTHIFVVECENHEDYGIMSEKAALDPKLEGLMESVSGANSPITIESQSLLAEVPLGRKGKAGRGSIVSAYISRTKPGMLQAGLELAAEAFDFVESLGGVNARLFVQTVAGSMADLFVATWEFDSMRSWGKAEDAYMSPKGQKIAAKLQSADCPTVVVSSHLLREIPI
jgi:hypothetical protein